MPSTLVHLALGGLVAAALLGREFDARALAVVLAVVVLPDLDTLAGLWIRGGHRSLGHTLLWPVLFCGLLAWDLRWRETSRLAARCGARGVRVAWVSLVALVGAAVAPDLFANGVNLFYPVHDQFYELHGKLLVSDQRGVVQTFVDLSVETGDGAPAPDPDTADPAMGNSSEVHYRTGVDPQAGTEDPDVERTFYVLQSGTDAMLVLLGSAVTGLKLWVGRGE